MRNKRNYNKGNHKEYLSIPKYTDLEQICAWHEIAIATANPEGNLKICRDCKGWKDGCRNYIPNPKYLKKLYSEGGSDGN